MKAIRAIFEKGVFRPFDAVNLPEQTLVNIQPQLTPAAQARQAKAAVIKILAQRFDSGETETSARHNEHQS